MALADVRALSHLMVRVSDLDRSVAFYGDVLGFEVIEDHKNEAKFPRVLGRIADLAVELLKTDGKKPEADALGFAGLSFSVSNLDEICGELHSRGVISRAEPKSFGAARLIFVPDPDGSYFELIEYAAGFETLSQYHARQAAAS